MPPLSQLQRCTLESQLLCAIRNKNVSKAANLLEEGVDVDTQFTIRSQLFPAISVAVEQNDYQMVEMLLDSGASLNSTRYDSECPLFTACSRGNEQMVRIILERSNPNVNIETGFDRKTPLHAASINGSPAIAEMLIQHGANIETQDMAGLSALHLSAINGHSAVCEVLLRNGARAGAMDNEENTPIMFAISKNVDMDVILEMAEQVPHYLCYPNKHGVTALMTAIASSRKDLDDLFPKLLGITKSNIPESMWYKVLNRRTDLGHTMLHYAVLEKKLNCVKTLLSIGSLVNSRNNLGQTPLVSAVKNDSTEIIKLLLAAGATTRMVVCNDEIYCKDNPVDTEMKDTLVDVSRTPPSLTNLCRINYCRKFGLSTSPGDMPKRYEEFLKYEYVEL